MLQNLPMEIIDKVFGYLKEKDKLNLAQVNEKIGCAFAYHARKKYRSLSVRDSRFPGDTDSWSTWCTDDELRVILSFCGPTIDNISIQCAKVMNQLGELIEKYCVNLTSAILKITNENFNALKPVLSMTRIGLLLESWDYRGTDLLQYVNPYCKDLVLNDITMAQEQHIRKLICLEKLNIQSCDVLNIFEICSHLPKLREFTTSRFEYPDDLKQDYVYPELEELTLEYFYIKLDLPICPKLKKLILFKIVSDARNLGQIISKYGNTLKTLFLLPKDYEYEFYAKQIIIALRKCKRVLFLRTGNDVIRHLFFDFLKSFITVLKKNGFNKEKRLEMAGDLEKTDEIKKELMEKFPNSEVWNLITLSRRLPDNAY